MCFRLTVRQNPHPFMIYKAVQTRNRMEFPQQDLRGIYEKELTYLMGKVCCTLITTNKTRLPLVNNFVLEVLARKRIKLEWKKYNCVLR